MEEYLSHRGVSVGRVDIYLEANERISDAAMKRIRGKSPKASVSYVIEILSGKKKGGPLILNEFINMN